MLMPASGSAYKGPAASPHIGDEILPASIHAFRSSIAHPMIAAFFLAGPPAVPALAQSWEKINPPGFATADFMAIDANDLVTVSGAGGVFFSADAGRTWTGGGAAANPVTYSQGGETVGGMAREGLLQADANGDLYAVTGYLAAKPTTRLGKTLFKSADHGFTWTAVVDSLPGVSVSISTNFFVAGDGNMYLLTNTPTAAAFSLLYLSKDSGKTWMKTGDLKYLWNFAADPDGRLYATGSKGAAIEQVLYHSEDQGATWDPLYTVPGNSTVHAIDASRKDGVVVALNGMKVAALLPGETAVKEGDGESGAGFATACVLTPDGGVILGAAQMGIKVSENGVDAFTTLNAGLGKDTASVPKLFKYDSKGNLYMLASQDLFILRRPGTALRPAVAPLPTLPSAFAGQGRDLSGRRSGGTQAARMWRAPKTKGNRD
jgi:hypothetical protein